jgi:hypothetical protein
VSDGRIYATSLTRTYARHVIYRAANAAAAEVLAQSMAQNPELADLADMSRVHKWDPYGPAEVVGVITDVTDAWERGTKRPLEPPPHDLGIDVPIPGEAT